MKKIFGIFIILASINLFGQTDSINQVKDPLAKKYLDKLSESYASHSTARFYFRYSLYNAQDSTSNQFQGYLFVKQPEKYKVIIPDQELFSDGIKTYMYNKKTNEMNITFVDPNNEAVYTPGNLLNLYKKGFKYSYRGLATFPAPVKKGDTIIEVQKSCHVIDLYPEHPKGKPYSIIRIWIDKDQNELVSVKYQMKSGIEQVVDILKTDFDIVINDKLFVFDKNNYPKDLDITDFTEK